MIILLVYLFFVVVLSTKQDFVKEVNSASLSWKAEYNKFSTWDIEKIRSMLGYNEFVGNLFKKNIEYQTNKKVEKKDDVDNDLPTQFDWRNESNCVHPIRNQGDCGSCYAFGTTESFSDRLCIKSDGVIDVVISPQNLIDCEIMNLGCDGGQPFLCWEHIEHYGVTSDRCVPYKGKKDFKCEHECTSNQTLPFAEYYTESTTLVESGNTEKIMTDLMNNGPQQAAFLVFEDFMTYKSGIYSYHSGRPVGGHAIKIIGWGENNESSEKYWIVANSWGTDWGMDGYFWIKRGVEPLGECGIESEVISGIPKLN